MATHPMVTLGMQIIGPETNCLGRMTLLSFRVGVQVTRQYQQGLSLGLSSWAQIIAAQSPLKGNFLFMAISMLTVGNSILSAVQSLSKELSPLMAGISVQQNFTFKETCWLTVVISLRLT